VSMIVMNRVWDHAQQSGTSLVVLLALADRSDEDGICWPGVAWIAQRARLQSRQARNILRQLEKSRDILATIGRGRNHTNLYLVTVGLMDDEITAIYQRRSDILPAEPDENKPAIQRHKTGNPASLHQIENRQSSVQNRQSSVQNRQSSVVKPAIAIAGDPLRSKEEEVDIIPSSEIDFFGVAKPETALIPAPADTEKTPETIWHLTVSDLALSLPTPTFETWVRGTTAIGWQDGTFVVGVPHTYARDWLQNRLRPQAERSLSRHLGRNAKVTFVVDPRPNQSEGKPQ